jgi:hypothetical protein
MKGYWITSQDVIFVLRLRRSSWRTRVRAWIKAIFG